MSNCLHSSLPGHVCFDRSSGCLAVSDTTTDKPHQISHLMTEREFSNPVYWEASKNASSLAEMKTIELAQEPQSMVSWIVGQNGDTPSHDSHTIVTARWLVKGQ